MASSSTKYLLFLIVTCHVFIWGLRLEDQLDNTDNALDRLTVRLRHLDRRLENLAKARNEVELVGKELTSRLDTKIGNGCQSARMYRCGNTPQCISEIRLCDGTEDCANGEDEASCENVFQPGDVFIGGFLHNFCLNEVRLEIGNFTDRWKILGSKRKPGFPQWEVVYSEYVYQSGTGSTAYVIDETNLHFRLGTNELYSEFILRRQPLLEVCRYLHSEEAVECFGERAELFGETERFCYHSYHKKIIQ